MTCLFLVPFVYLFVVTVLSLVVKFGPRKSEKLRFGESWMIAFRGFNYLAFGIKSKYEDEV